MKNEISKNLHIAKVINNNATAKNGSVQIKIDYLHDGVKDSFLPYALPFNNFLGGASTFGCSNIPENNSYVWVFYEDEDIQKNPFYIGSVNNEDVNPNKLFETNVKTTVGSEGVYPNVKFIYAQNGVCIAITTTTAIPEITIYHPKAYIFIDKNGYTYYKDAYDNRVKFDNTGIRIKDSKNNEIATSGTKLVINGALEISQ